ncbi:MAG: serine hydrolase [Alphaproteobacteria bacterium]|nr:serine hydrolase [Alphaproteobacteria bacterium]
MRRRDVLAGPLALCAVAAPASARPPSISVDPLVEEAMARARLPGLTLAVSLHGRGLIAKGYGRADIASGAPVEPATLFQIGSLCKAFTAHGVLQLVESGAVEPDAPIGGYVENLPPAWRSVTIRALLTHTGGLPAYDLDDDFWTAPLPRSELLRRAGPDVWFAPGDAFLYSNTGYCVLGWLIEDVAGAPYGEFVRTRIIQPLAMRDARPDDGEAHIPDKAEPYVLAEGGGYEPAVRMSREVSQTADGGLLLSAHDAIAWLNEMRAPRLIAPETAAAMVTPVRLNTGRPYPYAMGWNVDSIRGRPYYTHSGGVPGFTSFARWAPSPSVGVFLSTNCAGGGVTMALRRLAAQITTIFAPASTEYAERVRRDTAPAITVAARAILARTDPTIASALLASEAQIVSTSPQPEEVGPRLDAITEVAPTEEYTLGNVRARRYRVHYGDGLVTHILFGYASDGRICWVAVP